MNVGTYWTRPLVLSFYRRVQHATSNPIPHIEFIKPI